MIEQLVVVLVVGIMAKVAVAKYQKSLEVTRAEQAMNVLRAIGNAHLIWSTHHGRQFLPKLEPSNGMKPLVTNANCNATDCSSAANSCAILVACRYLASLSWDSDYWSYGICDPTTGTGGGDCCAPGANNGVVACARRKRMPIWIAPQGVGWDLDYRFWGYQLRSDGRMVVRACGGCKPMPPDPM